MSSLDEYLGGKRPAIAAHWSCIAAGDGVPMTLTAQVRAEGRSGIRRIRIRDFQVISDSDAHFAGYDLGPSSPELQLGVLGSCLTHTFLIQAATLGVRRVSLNFCMFRSVYADAARLGSGPVTRLNYSVLGGLDRFWQLERLYRIAPTRQPRVR